MTRRLEAAAMAVVLLVAWWLVVTPLHPIPWAWVYDRDLSSIRDGLHETYRLGDPWGWHYWAGAWVQGSEWPYWRPVASQLWLVEYHIWGEEFDSWRWVNYALQLGVLFAAWGFVSQLTRSRWAGFAAAILAAGSIRPQLLNHMHWFPMQTSIGSDLLWLASLWAFVAYLDRAPPPTGDRPLDAVPGTSRGLLALSLALMFLALAVREMSFAAIIGAVAIAWSRRRPVASWPLVSLGAVVLAWRVLVLPPGATTGTMNAAWWWTWPIRAAGRFLGPLGDPLAGPLAREPVIWQTVWPVVMGLVIAALLAAFALRPARRRRRVVIPALVGGLALSVLLAWGCYGYPEAVCGWDSWGLAAQAAVFALGVAVLWIVSRRTFLAGVVLATAFYLPVMGRPGVYHLYEQVLINALIYGILVAAAVAWARLPRWTLWVAVAAYLVPLAVRAPWWYESLLFTSVGPIAVLIALYRTLDGRRQALGPGEVDGRQTTAPA